MAGVRVLWSTQDWMEAIDALPVRGPLPVRTVLVPNGAVGHALKRAALEADRPDLLLGTRFVHLAALAAELLRDAGVSFRPGEDGLRPLRLRMVFASDLPLRYFRVDAIRATPGWDEAFASSMTDLEAAGLGPDDLPDAGANADRWHDLTVIWRAANEAAGDSWTVSRILTEAAARVEERRWGLLDCPVLAAVTGHEAAVEAQLIRALPEATIAVVGARPFRQRYVERIRALFGVDAAEAMQSGAPSNSADERDLLASYLFESPAVLAAPDRPRSDGPDGTVQFEDYAGVDEELRAASEWVAREVLEHETPLSAIGVIVPSIDPWAGLLVDRLRRLTWAEGDVPVAVASGLPLIATSAGARSLAIVSALAAHLSADALADVLPSLRLEEGEGRLSRGAALDLVYRLGTVGGSPMNPREGLVWPERMDKRAAKLAAQLDSARELAERGDETAARRVRGLEHVVADLRGVRAAVGALCDVAALVVGDAPLPDLARTLVAFLKAWVKLPGDGAQLPALLDHALADLCRDPVARELRGASALEVVEAHLRDVRVTAGRFGEPAVFVGPLEQAVGLPFRAIRVIGLCEGVLPSVPREDPILSTELRDELAERMLPGPADRVIRQLHALDRVVRDTAQRIVLSAPRLSIERTSREPSSVFVETAAALGRPDAATGERKRLIPTSRELERDAFAPGRRAARAWRHETPLFEGMWLERAARGADDVPGSWLDDAVRNAAAMQSLLTADQWTALDGILSEHPDLSVAGLSRDRPISSYRLRNLLECPHRFLLEDVLRWSIPPAPPDLRRIDVLEYGTLVHGVVEAFGREHGDAFGKRERSLDEWIGVACATAEALYVEFLDEYPLVSDAVKDQERERLLSDVREFVEYDWNDGTPRGFVDVERSFGYPAPVPVELGERTLYVRGFIDRLDLEGDTVLVRDLKTGKPHPRTGRETDASAKRDLQLGLYGTVVGELAGQWKLPSAVHAAYVYPRGRGRYERAFREDFDQLAAETQRWMELAAEILAARSFPRTPDPAADCMFCPFTMVCGGEAIGRSAAKLAAGEGVFERFHTFKSGQP